MSIEDDINEIRQIWSAIEVDAGTKFDLGKIWLERETLTVMEAKVEGLEEKVLHLLKIISASRHDKRELKRHMEHLISLLHNIKPTKEWHIEITGELDEIAKEINPHLQAAKEKVREFLQSKRRHETTKSSGKQIDLITIDLIISSRIGSREPESRNIGLIKGYLQEEKFLIKEIIFKGKIEENLLRNILEVLNINIRTEVVRYLREKGLNFDPYNVDIKIDFGQHPSEARTRVWYKRDGRIEIPSPQDFRLELIPIIAMSFNITRLDFDRRTEVLHIEAHI